MVKPVISIKLISNDGGVILQRRSTKKQSIFDSLRREIWESAYVRVIYKPEFINEGTYNNYIDSKKAINQFTEDVLLQTLDKDK